MVEEAGQPINLADIPEGEGSPDAQPLTFVNYSLKSRVRRQGGRVYGNWSSSFAQACIDAFERYIQEGSIVSISDAGRCDKGQQIVRAEHN